jgi:DNA repair exonuclease SbcCD ATPase subunit
MAKEGNITITNMVYGLGAAIVIVGALFKIQHWPFGSEILTLGMIVEAGVFTYSAFEKVLEDRNWDWGKAFPELVDEDANPREPSAVLSKKLDLLLKDAKIDSELVKSLGQNIKNLNSTASSMDSSAGASNRYNDEMAKATAQMESINNLYKAQLESATKQAQVNAESIENATKLKEQMESLASNLSSLNGVYGGMLSAMNKKAN